MEFVEKQTESRKRQHVELCVNEQVAFKSKTTGFEALEFEYNALPEINLDEVDFTTSFLNYSLSFPCIVSGMTGGYADATRINAALAEFCESNRIAMGVGSQRQALESNEFHESYSIVRRKAPSIPLIANIGAAELASMKSFEMIQSLVDLVEADAIAIHLNALQELLQPEGTPRFARVLKSIESCASHLDVPIMVKEVGAGISGVVGRKLLDAGVQIIDCAGAGGTSWAGVELLRSNDQSLLELWDFGIPTVECLKQLAPLKEDYIFSLIASGGVSNGFDIAKSIALGADLCAAARPFIAAFMKGGSTELELVLHTWQQQLRALMFLTGSKSISELAVCKLVTYQQVM